jgi:hypothetical protein
MTDGGISVREIFVDFNHVGWTGKVRARLFPEEREGLSVGEVVAVVGDSVPPKPARVLAIDGVEVELEYLESAPKAR